MTRREEALAAALNAERQGRWGEAMAIRAGVAEPPINLQDIYEAPWLRSSEGWDGKTIILDGCTDHDFTLEDVDVVLAYGDTGQDGWYGKAAGIARLKDGRYVAWESWWDATGSGFGRDAYGGDADIAFASTPGRALQYLSEQSRELLRWP